MAKHTLIYFDIQLITKFLCAGQRSRCISGGGRASARADAGQRGTALACADLKKGVMLYSLQYLVVSDQTSA